LKRMLQKAERGRDFPPARGLQKDGDKEGWKFWSALLIKTTTIAETKVNETRERQKGEINRSKMWGEKKRRRFVQTWPRVGIAVGRLLKYPSKFSSQNE